MTYLEFAKRFVICPATILATLSCSLRHTAAPPNVAATPVAGPLASVPAKKDAAFPPELLGWYVSTQCVEDLSPVGEGWIAFRVAKDHVDILHDDDFAERLNTELTVTRQDSWEILSGVYELGKATWSVDGYVLVDGPLVSPSTRREHASDPHLKTLHRRITFREHEHGMLVTVAPSESTGDHSKFGILECAALHVEEPNESRLDDRLINAGRAVCARATNCCLAVRSAKGANTSVLGLTDPDSNVCDNHPELTIQYCRRWLEMTEYELQWGAEWHCTPRADGHQDCSIPSRPKKPRAVPAECRSVSTAIPIR